MRALSSVVSGSLPLLLSAALPAAAFAVQTGVAAQGAVAGPAAAELLEVAVQDTVTVVPGARYRAGWMKRWLLGEHYRVHVGSAGPMARTRRAGDGARGTVATLGRPHGSPPELSRSC